MTVKNLCIGCLDDFVEEWADPPYCYTCYLKHQDAVERSGIQYSSRRNNQPVDWYGPKWNNGTDPNTIEAEELQYGFGGEDEYGRPIVIRFVDGSPILLVGGD